MLVIDPSGQNANGVTHGAVRATGLLHIRSGAWSLWRSHPVDGQMSPIRRTNTTVLVPLVHKRSVGLVASCSQRFPFGHNSPTQVALQRRQFHAERARTTLTLAVRTEAADESAISASFRSHLSPQYLSELPFVWRRTVQTRSISISAGPEVALAPCLSLLGAGILLLQSTKA